MTKAITLIALGLGNSTPFGAGSGQARVPWLSFEGALAIQGFMPSPGGIAKIGREVLNKPPNPLAGPDNAATIRFLKDGGAQCKHAYRPHMSLG